MYIKYKKKQIWMRLNFEVFHSFFTNMTQFKDVFILLNAFILNVSRSLKKKKKFQARTSTS